MSTKAKAVTEATKLATREDVVRAVKKMTDPQFADMALRLETVEAALIAFAPRPSVLARLWGKVSSGA